LTLEADSIDVGYNSTTVVHRLSLTLRPPETVALVGPNGSGKTTTLRALARLVPARSGAVYLDGREISSMPTRDVARRLALLPQDPRVPSTFTVRELVGIGRFPHRNWMERLCAGRDETVEWALEETRLGHLADREVDTLSGGERQRAWIAMALAQRTKLLLLDEPTTFLDVGHQLDVMETLDRLQAKHELAIVMVLHDMNQACRYADRIVVMKDGRIVAAGPPREILTAALIREVFGVNARISHDPESGTAYMIPVSRAARTQCTSETQGEREGTD